MDTHYSLNPDSLRSYNRWHGIMALILLALLLLLPWTLGIGPSSWRECLPTARVAAAPAAVTPAPTPAPIPAAAPAPPAPVPETIPAAKVFFDLDRVNLPGDVDRTLADVVAYLKSHEAAEALVSGFHDARGSGARNQELALNRARGVRGALETLGILRDRIAMNKPQETTGSGSNEEARRVEVTIQP